MSNQNITIQAFKYPHILHYEWQGELIEKTDDYAMILCCPGRKFHHHTKNKILTFDNWSVELFFFKEWFTAAFGIEDKQIKSCYCNIAQPTTLKENVLSFVDLDIDLVKATNAPWAFVDEDEFLENSLTYKYPIELIEKTKFEAQILWNKVHNKHFPFDGSIDELIENLIY